MLGPTLVVALAQATLKRFPTALRFIGSAAVAAANGFLCAMLFSLAALAPGVLIGHSVFDHLSVIALLVPVFALQVGLLVWAIVRFFRDPTAKRLRFLFLLAVLSQQGSLSAEPSALSLAFLQPNTSELARLAALSLIMTITSLTILGGLVLWIRAMVAHIEDALTAMPRAWPERPHLS